MAPASDRGVMPASTASPTEGTWPARVIIIDDHEISRAAPRAGLQPAGRAARAGQPRLPAQPRHGLLRPKPPAAGLCPLPRGQRARREADPRRPSGRLTQAHPPADRPRSAIRRPTRAGSP